jgi:hypothetical protein
MEMIIRVMERIMMARMIIVIIRVGELHDIENHCSA